MSEQLSEEQTKRLLEISGQLKQMLDMGALAPRAASMNSTLAPGVLVDMVWNIIFGKAREESLADEKNSSGLFLLSVWNGNPMMTWHLNHVPKEHVIMLLSTAVAMAGQRFGNNTEIIDKTISTLEALKKNLLEDDDSGEKPH